MEINKFKGRTIMAKEMIAMILAGGQGSRLYALTQKLAKPAVPFGGKYRIIDFPLSNCVNSDIDTVGILTPFTDLFCSIARAAAIPAACPNAIQQGSIRKVEKPT